MLEFRSLVLSISLSLVAVPRVDAQTDDDDADFTTAFCEAAATADIGSDAPPECAATPARAAREVACGLAERGRQIALARLRELGIDEGRWFETPPVDPLIAVAVAVRAETLASGFVYGEIESDVAPEALDALHAIAEALGELAWFCASAAGAPTPGGAWAVTAGAAFPSILASAVMLGMSPTGARRELARATRLLRSTAGRVRP
jgi:hypothetical protein